MNKRYTHEELVNIGRIWLMKPVAGRPACTLAITELTTGETETPDCLGWSSSISVMVECKTSRGDFLSDKKKYFRRIPDMGVGMYRYYLVPAGLVSKAEVPENWGLIEVNEKGKTRCVKRALAQEANHKAEVTMLLSLIRRVEIKPGRHIAITAHGMDCENPRATVTTLNGECDG